MDNEEIRELLKELKESSDESSAVRSRVVKIHFDTPQEAERRERARRKAAEAARQKALEEEEERRAEEEARREAAEKEAEAVVAEAKAEAAAEFSADLGKDLLSQETGEDDELSDAADLHFNWEYKYRRLSEESPAPAGGEVLSGTDEKERPSGKGKSTAGEADEEEPDDQEDWKRRMEESPDGSRKKASFKGLSGRLPGLKSIKGRIQSRRAKDAEEEEEPEAEADRPEEISEDFETDPVSSGKRRGRKAAESKTPESRLSESRASESKTSEARKKRIAAPGQDDFESDADYFRDDEPEEKREKKASAGRAPALFAGAAGVLASLKGAVSGKGSGDRKRGKKTEEDDFPDELPVEGEEKGRAYDGNPETDDYDIDPELAYLFEDEEDEPFGTEDADFGPAEQEALPEESDLKEEGPDSEAVSPENADFSAKAETAPAGSGTEALPEAEADRESPDPDQAGGDTGLKAGEQPGQDAGKEPRQKSVGELLDMVAEGRRPDSAGENRSEAENPDAKDSVEGESTAEKSGAKADDLAAGGPGQGPEPGDGGDDNPPAGRKQSIEVVDLDETVSNRGVEVIELDKQSTGVLPSAAEMKAMAAAKKKALARRKILIGCGIAAGALLLILGIWFAVTHFKPGTAGTGRGESGSIAADDGLTVRILEQPQAYTTEGDVRLSVKTQEAIQSITVNGESIPFEGEKKAEFSYHATGGTLDLMVVSTDSLRNAVVKLAYVDSDPPTVLVSSDNGLVTLSAEDGESGVEGIYYGTYTGFSTVPEYQLYTEPFATEEDEYVSFYAVDKAGNRSAPITSTLEPAESIAFNETSYTLFPGSTTKLSIEVKPEGAYCNNLALTVGDSNIAVIGDDGLLKGVSEGETQVMATADGIKGIACNVTVSSERKVKLSLIGDCTLGTDANFSPMNSFNAYQALHGDSYFFDKVRSIFQADDATFANFEGTLTTLDTRADKEYAFKGDPAFANILVDGGIEVVTLANNHSSDYGEQSLIDTEENLAAAGVDWCTGDTIAYETLNGIKCAFIGIYSLQNGTEKLDQVKRTIGTAKNEGAQIIVVAFHWSNELVTEVDEYQTELAHTAIDEGATLVVGHHPHVLQGIELYKGRYIVYSLANFCFGGNVTPADSDTIIFQQTFTVNAEGVDQNDEIAIIPCRVSTDPTVNNYQPTPVSGDRASAIMSKINERSAPFGQTWTQYMVEAA